MARARRQPARPHALPADHKRPKLVLPGNARVAVWTIVNVENWSPLGADAAHGAAAARWASRCCPTCRTGRGTSTACGWASGASSRCWRARKLKATFALNGTVVELYREACQAALDAGWEFMGHGFVQRPMHRVDDQRAAIARHHRGDQGLHRQAAARLGEPGPDRDRRDARPAGRGRHRVRRRLGARRAAGAARDARRHDRLGALHGRDQRRRDQRRRSSSRRTRSSAAAATSSTGCSSTARRRRA